MRKILALTATAGVLAVSGPTSVGAQSVWISAGVPVAPGVAFYTWDDHRYCWYDDGWSGPGWYWCGAPWRAGYGWGGPWGWHGWRGGHPHGWYVARGGFYEGHWVHGDRDHWDHDDGDHDRWDRDHADRDHGDWRGDYDGDGDRRADYDGDEGHGGWQSDRDQGERHADADCVQANRRSGAIGAVAGAVGGAVIGSAITHGNGGATLLGAGAGALTGNAIGRNSRHC